MNDSEKPVFVGQLIYFSAVENAEGKHRQVMAQVALSAAKDEVPTEATFDEIMSLPWTDLHAVIAFMGLVANAAIHWSCRHRTLLRGWVTPPN